MKRSLSDLTVEDLRKHPIWATDPAGLDDEFSPTDLTVYPTDGTDPKVDRDYLVFTEFVLQNGQVFFGYCFPWDSSGIDYTQPTIISKKGHVNLFYGAGAADVEQILGIHRSQIFPIKFSTLVSDKGGHIYTDTIKS